MKLKATLFAAVGLLVLSTACSPKPFPAGAYKPVQSSNPVLEFSFAADGTYAISYYDDRGLSGTYAASGDKLTLNDSEGGPCYGKPVTMSWASTGNSLTLKTVEDTCSQGLSYDFAGEWTRQP